ncbi:Conserved_hypothetical protein [Hexamita inflata]|uniref:Transmembrane protein n=1 Tax=Hexamita inflata TaxID=28002 RepID=A0AA86QYU3_9EUKA|nr:Conserved hypothetical protein [Hexamita inflata]
MLNLVIYIILDDTCTLYEGSDQLNPTIVINDPQTIEYAYLGYNIYYTNIDHPNSKIRLIYTSVPAEQLQINVTVYGKVWKICTYEFFNMQLYSEVSQVTDIKNFKSSQLKTDFVIFIDEKYDSCSYPGGTIQLAANTHDQLLSLYFGKSEDWSSFEFNEHLCSKRQFIDIQPENGVIVASQNDVFYPVYNKNLQNYGLNYGQFLYPLVYTQNGYFDAPTNSLNEGDTITLSESIMIGHHTDYVFENKFETILVGAPIKDRRQDGFENVTIQNKCVQFYANSPRNIEYPLNSGIIFNIRTPKTDGLYTLFFGPYICVDTFNYMPAMFYTAEDPALKEIFNNLTNINNSFEESVKDGSWEYLTNDKTANEIAYNYTRYMIQALNDMCLKAYFSDSYLFNLSKCLIFVFCPLIGINIIMSTYRKIVKAKADKQLNQPSTPVVKKKAASIGYIFSILSFVLLILVLIFIQKFRKLQLSLIFIIGVLYIIFRGLRNYEGKDPQNTSIHAGSNTQAVSDQQMNKQQIYQKRTTFWIQYFVQAIFRALDIVQTVTDIMQILQYLQIQYYQNRTGNIIFLMYPSQKILQAAQYLAQNIAYPLILLGISLINQEIMKQEWFKKCITPSPDSLDNKTFLIKQLIYVFSYCQGFIYNVFFEFTYTKFNFAQIPYPKVQYNLQVILKIYLSGTIYSISKFQLILEYYQQLNKAVIKIFTHIVQILINLILIIVTIVKLFILTLQCEGQAMKLHFKILSLSVFKLVYFAVMLVVDPIVTVFLPTSLMFQEMTKLCPFLLQVVGICDHQDEFAKQTENLLKIDVDKFWQNILSSVEVYGISIFFGLMFSKDQNKSIQPKDQWHAIFFGAITFITPYICQNYLGDIIMKKFKLIINSDQIVQNINGLNQNPVETNQEKVQEQLKSLNN